MLHKTLPFSRVARGGGVDYQVHYLSNALVQRGHQVTVFSMDPKPPDARYEAQGVPVPAAVMRHKLLFRYFLGLYFRRIDYRRFQVVHAHGDDHFLGRGQPLVRTFYGTAWDEALSATTWKRRVSCLLYVPLEVWSAYKAHVSVGISEATLARLPFVKRIIPCGVDLSLFRAENGKTPYPSILFVGTLHGRKRGEWLLRQFQEHVRRALPEAELWMVCDDEEIPAPATRWFRRLPTSELVRLYQQAWVFCLPSAYEGFGVPYVEAMACGAPVVATPNPGACEVLRQGDDGVLAQAERLGETLVALLQDAAKRGHLRERGLQRARDFAFEAVAARYEAVYQQAMELANRA